MCPAREPIQVQDSNRRQQRGQRNATCCPPMKKIEIENGHTNQGKRNLRALGQQLTARHAKSVGQRSSRTSGIGTSATSLGDSVTSASGGEAVVLQTSG